MELPGFFDELDKLIRRFTLLSADHEQVVRELKRYAKELEQTGAYNGQDRSNRSR